MPKRQNDDIRRHVQNYYSKIAASRSNCCGCSSCCSSKEETGMQDSSQAGYSHQELTAVPEGADMNLGCGNPQAIARLQPGETVVDLGSGSGLDCFLAAKQVGNTGQVIGIDMTPEMLEKARANARKGGYENIEFRLGEIENLPVADASADVIISNCVINLSPDKQRVFDEAFRVLRQGGRMAVSDIVAVKVLPEKTRNDLAAISGCVAGAAQVSHLEDMIRQAGFQDVKIAVNENSRSFIKDWFPGTGFENYVSSALIEAVK